MVCASPVKRNVVCSITAVVMITVLVDDDDDEGDGDERPDGHLQRDQIESRAFLMFQPYPGPRPWPAYARSRQAKA